MEFGMQFFPANTVERMPAARYWTECLELVRQGEQLGFNGVRTVEHYFHPYGGYSPNPLMFLAAAAKVTKTSRLVTGAVLPVFNNPLKLAAEIAMVDAISNGRLDVGFGRAFLPHEFDHFGISMDESRARFDEGVEQIRLLLSGENVTHEGRFHSFRNVTSYPRPTQRPHPPFWVAAGSTEESFVTAAKNGFGMMTIPASGGFERMAELIRVYRKTWAEAGHPGRGRITAGFHMYCAPTREQAFDIARAPLNQYLALLADAAAGWNTRTSGDYKDYDQRIPKLAASKFEDYVAAGTAWVGSPDDIIEVAARFNTACEGIDNVSLQVNFTGISMEDALASMRLFADEVMPHFRQAPARDGATVARAS